MVYSVNEYGFERNVMASEFSSFAITGYYNTEAPPEVSGRIVGLAYWYEGLANWINLYFFGRTEPAPTVPPGTAFHLFVRWSNDSAVTICGHVDLTITKPDGTKTNLSAVLNQNNWAAPEAAWPVQFEPVILDQVGEYQAKVTLSTMGQVLDEKTYTIASVTARVEVTSITLDKTSLLDWDEFTISITFSNPHEYDVWVRPQFGFGNLIGGEFNVVPALMGLTWENGIEPGGSGAEWVDLGIVAIMGSNMTRYVYDPAGCALVTGEYAYLKVPAKGTATTTKKWTVATYHERRGPGGLLRSGKMFGMIPGPGYVPDWYNYCVIGNEYMVEYFAGKEYPDDAWEFYEPIPRIWAVCVKVESAFAVIYHPEGIGTCYYGLPEAVGKTRLYERVAYEPFLGVAEDLVSVGVEHADWQDDRGYWHRYYWQRYVGTEAPEPPGLWQPIFEDATPPDWW